MAICYVKAYFDWIEQTAALSDAERGRLFIAILEYARSGLEPKLDGREGILFPVFRAQLDRDNERAKTSSENGKKGGRPKTNQNLKKPNLTKPNQTKGNKEKEEEKEYTPHKSPQGDDDVFSEFWAAYPNKRCGKANALKAWRKIKHTPELDADIMNGLERQKAWPQWEKDGGQYVPMATTWLNQRRWDAEGGGGDDYWR